MIKKIIDELNKENGSNYKIEILSKYKENQLLKRALKMAYDRVVYTYGITLKNVNADSSENLKPLSWALDILENDFCTRKITGNAAISTLETILESLSEDDRFVVEKIINRDLRINMGRSQINKVFPNLITKPPYMRCGLYTPKTAKKISQRCYVQIKADGTYRYVTVDNGNVTFHSRSGEESFFPNLKQEFEKLPNGVYIGELLVKNTTNRAEGNGLINSDTPPHGKIYMQLWDFVSLDEFGRPKDKKNKTVYHDRFQSLKKILRDRQFKHIELITTKIVNSHKEAMRYVSNWMKQGLEGGVLKDPSNIFVDHTSPTQLKMKLCIDLDVRCTGFYEGTPGTKREKTFGGITYKTDDGEIKGRTSGFTDKQLEDFNSRREELIGQIFTIECNDITQARDSETYALSHPRFIEFRSDKTDTDTLERAFEIKEMAMNLE